MSAFRETVEAIRVLGIRRVLYGRLIYRHHMRFIHKRGGHQLKVRPIDQSQHCSWCGHLVSKDGVVLMDGPAMMKRDRELVAEANRTGRLGSIADWKDDAPTGQSRAEPSTFYPSYSHFVRTQQ